jgi:hypothetical protein
MEEISWAQRVFGHRPPEYFLAENYQQELNLHNIASTELRLLTFRGIVLGYGVVLPLIGLLPVARRWLDRLGVVVPPIALAPSMFAMFWLHLTYPWKFTGEVVECGVGFGFLFIALAHVAQFSKERGRSKSWSIVGISGLVVLLAFTTAWWSQNRQAGDPMNLELAEVETESLASDLLDAAEAKGKPSISKCGLHKRVYTVVEGKRSARPLRKGRFAGLVEGGLPEARAEFFLDPWNSPYWIRDRCDKGEGRRVVFVYSFGPNRSRDSNRWEILGDDLGKYVLVEPKP